MLLTDTFLLIKRLRVIPTIAESPRPESLTGPKNHSAPPSPRTNIVAVIISILGFVRSIRASTMFLIPIEAIIPKRRIEIPPITGEGIAEITAVNFGIKERNIANTAATLMITGL